MKVSGVHWAVFAFIMMLSIAAGVILADHYLEKRAEIKALKE